MRLVGQLPNENDAQRFAAFLITEGITAHAEAEDGHWSVWVREEDATDRAKQELEAFRSQPRDARYQNVERLAQERLLQEHRQREAARKNIIEPSTDWKAGAPRRIPLTRTLVAMSIIATILASTLMGRDSTLRETVAEQLSFVNYPDYLETQDPLVNIKQGEVWRLVTPAFVHADPVARGFGVFHILFNMYWLVHFGGMIEDRRGSGLLAMVALLTAIGSNVAQATFPEAIGSIQLPASLHGAVLFGGMSGVVYGLFGFVWIKSRTEPTSGLWIDPTTAVLLFGWLILCMTGVVGPVANIAHAAGLIVGILMGLVPTGRASAAS
ncbi:MAG: rhomboid family intramembrane serine protease [Pirellulaceae bacterium]